ncbi:hypothetical protein SLEP1_g40303 [Rubroshorea leprosula]|uniref:Uncharacterized protein n=1 Tax=Rubroshorea leprosula TaxID=152421 RepID=A0AAV5L3V2_9ROSI|nr:hypothetical protein SLEP1_g40303 [Rubroshorea leprosula]
MLVGRTEGVATQTQESCSAQQHPAAYIPATHICCSPEKKRTAARDCSAHWRKSRRPAYSEGRESNLHRGGS